MTQEELDKALAPYVTEILKILKEGRIDVSKIPVPQVTVNVPDVIVPSISIPEIKIPEIKLPSFPRIPAPQVTVNVDEVKVRNFPTSLEKEILEELKKIEKKKWGSGYSYSGPTQYLSGETVPATPGVTGLAALWEDTGGVVRSISAAHPLPVSVLSGVSSGTQYADGAARGTATGTIAMVDDGTNVQSMSGDSSGRPNVNINGTVTVTGPLTDTQLRNTAVPISAASLPLPTGASTLAKQPALGTAGAASSDVITVQGVASMTPILATVTGTATVNVISGFATAAAQTDASQVTQIRSVTKSTSTGAGVTSTAASATRQPLDVTIYKNDGTALDPTQIRALTSGDTVTAVQATGTNLHTVVDSGTVTTVSTVSAARIVGNTGAVLDAVNTAATAPANGVLGLGIYNSTEPSPTTGQSVGIQLDAKGRQRGVIMDAAGNARGANVDANNNLGVVLAAETTKVLGVTRTADGAGNLLTSNSTTYTAKFGLDGNLLGTLGTAFSTAGKVDVKGADGDVFVRQATGTNLHVVIDSGTLTANQSVNVAQFGGTNVVNGGVAGVQAVGGNVANAVTATANPVPVGGIFTTTPATLTTGQTATLQFTPAQNLKNDVTTWGATAVAAAAALGLSLTTTPTVPRVGADMLGRRSDGTANTDPAILATTVNPAGSGTAETAIEVSLRKTSASGASTEYGTTTSPMLVGGDAASGATDIGNPNKIGGIAKTTAPTAVTAAQRVNAWFDLNGRQAGFTSYSFYNSTANNTTTTVKSGAGVLHSITINTRGTTSSVIVYDNTAGSGTIIATIDTTLSTTAFLYDVAFATGLTIKTNLGGAAADLTISYL